MTDEEYKKNIKQFHRLSDRHILVAETDMPYSDILQVVALSNNIRKAGNELVGLMRKKNDYYIVQWTGQDEQQILKTITRMEQSRKVVRLGGTQIIIKN